MIVKATSQFFKKRDSLISKEIISLEEYEETRDRFKANPKDPKIRPHKINCKKSQTIISISIINKQERILVNMKDCDDTIAIFSWIGKHREYEKIIKDSRNCKSIFIDCEEAQKALEVYKNGNAYVSIDSNDRQPISYNGYLMKNEISKK